ncbi:MAG: PGPGW domain-containing protein [Candidatus Saccharimonadales bacterium]
MEYVRRRWKSIPKAVRKPLVFIFGFAVVGAGVFMLVFPGPGWAAIFVGFAILATEFAFAERVRDWLLKELKIILHNARRAWRALWRKIRRKKSS